MNNTDSLNESVTIVQKHNTYKNFSSNHLSLSISFPQQALENQKKGSEKP